MKTDERIIVRFIARNKDNTVNGFVAMPERQRYAERWAANPAERFLLTTTFNKVTGLRNALRGHWDRVMLCYLPSKGLWVKHLWNPERQNWLETEATFTLEQLTNCSIEGGKVIRKTKVRKSKNKPKPKPKKKAKKHAKKAKPKAKPKKRNVRDRKEKRGRQKKVTKVVLKKQKRKDNRVGGMGRRGLSLFEIRRKRRQEANRRKEMLANKPWEG